MTSIVIAAHNEAAVIGRCLAALRAAAGGADLDITVVANGCDDATAAVAAAVDGVRVLEVPEPGKSGALNLGDAVARGFPRAYLDADIVVSGGGLVDLCTALTRPGGPLAVVPRRRLVLTGRPWTVRAYFAVHDRLPAHRSGLFGRGLVVLSAEGRARFDRFPSVIADDLFLDSLFTAAEKQVVETAEVWVETPRRGTDLLRRLVRVRRGNAALRAASLSGDVPGAVRPARRLSWLVDVALPRPWLWPSAVVYAGFTVVAGLRARRPARGDAWGRDASTREGIDVSG